MGTTTVQLEGLGDFFTIAFDDIVWAKRRSFSKLHSSFRLPYATIFGGAEAFRKEHFEEINGFSNRFWGWGGEDDDLFLR